MTVAPVLVDEFASLMAPLGPFLPDTPQSPLGLAVSGGADSMAMAWLARQWRHNVLAFVVDHGLRAGSAAEAVETANRLAAFDVKARILTLEPLKPGRVQERARQGRYQVLEEACVAQGCIDLLLAHHQHDQDETVWMRHARLTNGAPRRVAGLGGMAPVLMRGRIRVVRPFLALEPERLRATLRHAGLDWVEDPSNCNRRFERVRWRQDLTPAMRGDARLWHSQARQSVSILRFRRGAWLAEQACWHPAGWVHVRQELPDPDGIGDIIRVLGGREYRPAEVALVRLLAQRKGTLGGVLMRPAGRFGSGVLLLREERAVSGPVPAAVGARWDGRWRLVDAGWPEGVGPDRAYPAGAYIDKLAYGLSGSTPERPRQEPVQGHAQVSAGLSARRIGIPSAALRVLPAVYCDNRLISLPSLLGGPARFVWDAGGPLT